MDNTRRSEGYDYSLPGGYFVTVVIHNRECILGEIENSQLTLSPFGTVIEDNWNRITKHFLFVRLDPFQIMPNHIHGIIVITDRDEYTGEAFPSNSEHNRNDSGRNASPLQNQPRGAKSGSLSAIMQNFESVTTRRINNIRKTPGKKIWQRNYYEHIIRTENELHRIREYIVYNPLKWETDEENPKIWETKM